LILGWPVRAITLGQARLWLEQRLDKGAHCPCCNQYAKVYKRQINAEMAHSLGKMYVAGLHAEDGWVHLPTVLQRKQADETKLVYWELIEEAREARPDGGRAGWWRVTEAGETYLRGNLLVQKYALIYDGKFVGFEGELRTIHDAMGVRFDLMELMKA
jgi:hypothetical protein